MRAPVTASLCAFPLIAGFTSRRREYWLSMSVCVPVDHDAAGQFCNAEHESNAWVIESPSAAMEPGAGVLVGVASSSMMVPVATARLIETPAGSDVALIVTVS